MMVVRAIKTQKRVVVLVTHVGIGKRMAHMPEEIQKAMNLECSETAL